MFNIKRLFFLLVFIISVLFSFQNGKIIFSVLREMLSGKDFGILLLAWPLVLGWLIYAIIFICLIVWSWKKMKEIDLLQKSKLNISATQAEDKMFRSVKISPIVIFGICLATLILVGSIFTGLSK